MPSAVIAKYEYDELRQELMVTYQSGITYRYLEVPVEVYRRMRSYTSKGAFLNLYIKGQYEFIKVGDSSA